jgi:hypothetical protein
MAFSLSFSFLEVSAHRMRNEISSNKEGRKSQLLMLDASTSPLDRSHPCLSQLSRRFTRKKVAPTANSVKAR